MHFNCSSNFIQSISWFTSFSNCVIILLKKPSAANTRLNNWLGWGIPSDLKKDQKPTSGCNLRVGFYFLLLLELIYVKRARINDPNKNMIVNVSFTSMASPPFEGKPCPPKIQLSFLLYHHLPSRGGTNVHNCLS